MHVSSLTNIVEKNWLDGLFELYMGMRLSCVLLYLVLFSIFIQRSCLALILPAGSAVFQVAKPLHISSGPQNSHLDFSGEIDAVLWAPDCKRAFLQL